MSKNDKSKKTEAREPWEQSIYEPDKNSGGSRLEKRQQMRGNTVFLTILVILLLLIIALPIGTFLWVMRDNPTNKTANNSQPSSSLVQSSTKKESSTSTSTTASTAPASSEQPASSEAVTPSSSSVEPTTPSSSEEVAGNEAATDPVYGTVQAGEGFNQVAARYGTTADQLLALNPNLTINSVITPGQSIRVK